MSLRVHVHGASALGCRFRAAATRWQKVRVLPRRFLVQGVGMGCNGQRIRVPRTPFTLGVLMPVHFCTVHRF